MGTIPKTAFHRASALLAVFLVEFSAGYGQRPFTGSFRRGNKATAFTHQERLATLDGDEGYEKKAQIVVDALQPGLSQSTRGTKPLCIIQSHGSGLDTPYEEEHGFLPFPMT